jgi:amidophosphoribosyltransferase
MCGIAGAFRTGGSAVDYLYIMALSLQHRGKEGAGMAWQSQGKMFRRARLGEVTRALSSSVKGARGEVGIVQNRYSTTGKVCNFNSQPMGGEFLGRSFQLVHNGNVVNLSSLRKQCGRRFSEHCSDTFIIAKLLEKSPKKTMEEALVWLAGMLQGGFNLIVLFEGRLYILKDRFGFHPLQLGRCEKDIFAASESCAFGPFQAELSRDIRPGEIIIASPNGRKESFFWTDKGGLKFDLFEYIYFSRPDSFIHGVEVGRARQNMGRKLAQLYPIDADMVIPIPDSGNEAALGYFQVISKHRDVEFQPNALFRPHIVSRTFIEPVREMREETLRLKFSIRPDLICGKRVIAVDDSMVRGTTSRKAVGLLWQAGAKEVHWLLSSPPYVYPEYYGIDTYREGERLIYPSQGGDLEKVAQEIGATTIRYLDLDSLIEAILEVKEPDSPLNKESFHAAPFNGIYEDGKGDYA